MDIVLHHYPTSPYAEVVRLALGLKGATYGLVEIPSVAPKPDLAALTGGYERTPVLQIGADIHCDTVAICDALEARVHGPSLYPAPSGAAGRMIALWAGSAPFGWAVGSTIGLIADKMPEAFFQDRKRRFGLDVERLKAGQPHLDAQLRAALAVVEEALADGRPFVGGEDAGHADLALYMLVWFQRLRGLKPDVFGNRVGEWAGRVAAIGHGSPTEMTAEAAIAKAAACEPTGTYTVEGDWAAGQAVRVKTDTPDPATVEGALIGLSHRAIVIERTDPRAGRVHVHLPRMGQMLDAGMSDTLSTAVASLMRRVAHDIVLPRFRHLTADQVEEKSPGDLVTVADREAEVALAEGLLPLVPGSRVVGEEGVAADAGLLEGLDSGTAWIVDPIDGTGNFAAGRAPFGVMVALCVDGEVRAGWLLDPLTDRLCHARVGEGAWLNGEPVRARESGAPLPIAGLATSFLSTDERARLEGRAAGHLTVVPIPRCAAEQYPRLVLGENDLSVFERTLPWDHAPGALFLSEAGGRIARRDGSPYRIWDGRTGLLGASSPAMWDRGATLLFG